MIKFSREKRSLLFASFVLALFFHGFSLYWAHLSQLHSKIRIRSYFENRELVSKQDMDKYLEEQKQKRRYLEELNQVLKKMIVSSSQYQEFYSDKKNQAPKSTLSSPSSQKENVPKEAFSLSQNHPPSWKETKEQEKSRGTFNFSDKELTKKQHQKPAASPFASTADKGGNRKELLASTPPLEGDVLTSSLNSFDNAQQHMQFGSQYIHELSQSQSSFLEGSTVKDAKELDIQSNPFHLAIPSEKETLSSLLMFASEQEKKDGASEKIFLSHQGLQNQSLEDIPELQDLKNAEGLPQDYLIPSNDDFQISFKYRPLPQGSYIFELSLNPKNYVQFKRIRQNFYFLIDRSNSINKERYRVFKDAVAKVLPQLHKEDSFNILVFDNHVVSLAEKPLTMSTENVEKARSFLQQQTHGGMFASTDIYASLDKIIPQDVADTEVNIAILLSDGDTYLNVEGQRQTIYRWTKKNKRKISLFSVATGDNNNLPLLELLSSFNKGTLFYSKYEDQLGDKLTQAVSKINTPIGKNIVANAFPKEEHANITLYPRSGRLPDMYENSPYRIYGTIDKPCDFIVFLQGKHYDHWLNIKQEIRFKDGKEGQGEMEKNWTVYKAYDHYENYLRDGQKSQLKQANQMLSELNVQGVFGS